MQTPSDVGESTAAKLSPSQFMRELRPEYYSDSKDRVAYVLDAPTLEYHLETITSRNQTHDFEIFCRKLCERAICPNLRPQSGPEGGGDSKVDTETYPAADEKAIIYLGEPNAGRERWAFAFSAKAKWIGKVRSDVKGIADTAIPYDKIICVTSKFARAKTRSNLERELSKKYGIPVIIHDRSWIVKEVIENERKDIAFNYLHVGEEKANPLRLGPEDYSRQRQLADIEKLLDNQSAYDGMERQRATDALVAAKLSRYLERPRIETDGRFDRAIRLADAYGTNYQELEARYERIWTGYWWFDDLTQLLTSYEAFEELVLKTSHSTNLEFLTNLMQLLFNSVSHEFISREQARLDERIQRLTSALNEIAADRERPNNALEAETSLLILRLNRAMIDQDPSTLPQLWSDFATALDKANGLGEFNADRLVSMIELAGNIAGNEPSYDALIERLAEFVGDRKSEGEGAIVLLKRAQKLEFSEHITMIRILGKAVHALTKKEYREHLIEALQLLTLAYRSAGLIWAARATAVFLTSTIIIEAEKEDYPTVSIVPALKSWAWLALELRHLPDLLLATQLTNGATRMLPLAEDSKEKVINDHHEIDIALASQVLNLNDEEVGKLQELPDILESLSLFSARTALLYTLGYEDALRKDGSLPSDQSDAEVARLLSILASQPIADETQGPLILNEARQRYRTVLLGMVLQVTVDDSPQAISVTEGFLSSLEAFFATLLAHNAAAHTEEFSVTIHIKKDIAEPTFDISPMDMVGTINWPAELSIISFEQQKRVHSFFMEVVAQIVGTTCVIPKVTEVLDRLFADEAVQQRMLMATVALTSYHRITSKTFSELRDWAQLVRNQYPLRQPRPQLDRIAIQRSESSRLDSPDKVKDHRGLGIRSVIDTYTWDKAKWRAAAYGDCGPYPPWLALTFEDREAATKIFERWRERFGERDVNGDIYIGIVRHLPNHHPSHYGILVTSKLPNPDDALSFNKPMLYTSRSMTMEPESDINLTRFLDSFARTGMYFLMPAILTPDGPEFIRELAIAKRDLSVKEASEIGDNEPEGFFLKIREDALGA